MPKYQGMLVATAAALLFASESFADYLHADVTQGTQAKVTRASDGCPNGCPNEDSPSAATPSEDTSTPPTDASAT